ncbi:MAG: signal peptidase II [Clostridia bacterium]|nr:signal peptidase II [Clostridia bacterium]
MWYAVIFCAVLLLDQITKILVAAFSGAAGAGGAPVHEFWIIDDFIEIAYCENKSGAMGLFAKLPYSQEIFLVVTVLILGGIISYLLLSRKKRGKWLNVTLSLVLSGAVGNFIDRIFTVYVRDFIHVILPFGKDGDFFPYIFNVADMALVIGAIMLVVYLLFIDKDALFKKSARKTGISETNVEKAGDSEGNADA